MYKILAENYVKIILAELYLKGWGSGRNDFLCILCSVFVWINRVSRVPTHPEKNNNLRGLGLGEMLFLSFFSCHGDHNLLIAKEARLGWFSGFQVRISGVRIDVSKLS